MERRTKRTLKGKLSAVKMTPTTRCVLLLLIAIGLQCTLMSRVTPLNPSNNCVVRVRLLLDLAQRRPGEAIARSLLPPLLLDDGAPDGGVERDGGQIS